MTSTPVDSKVADFVRSLALAWKNLAAYPSGHPALAGSLDSVHARLNDLRGPAGDVALGIAADGLLYGATKVDSLYAQKLAHALHVRGVAVVRFAMATTSLDLEIFLRLIHAANTKHMSEDLTAAGVINIHLQHVDYSGVQMTSDLDEPPARDRPALWEEIIRALLAGRALGGNVEQLAKDVQSVDELAALIAQAVADDRPQAEFDPNATFGVRFTSRVPETPELRTARVSDAIALYVAGAKGTARKAAVQQVVQLLRALPAPLRTAVLRAVAGVVAGDDDPAALRELASELAADDVLDALRYLAGTRYLSEHALLLLRSLMDAGQKPQAPKPPPTGLLEDLVTLFGDEDIDRFNPPDHQALLQQVSIDIPHVAAPLQPVDVLGVRVDSVAEDVLNRQLSRTLLELLAARGDSDAVLARLASIFRAFLDGGAYTDAFELIERLRETGTPLARFADAATLRELVETMHDAPPERIEIVKKLTEQVGLAASDALIAALAEEESLGRRRRLFDFAVSLGPSIAPAATRFLSDPRWFVVRNMIILLRTVNDHSSLAEIRNCARHDDLRVRMEAIKSLLTLDPTVPRALLDEAIHAADPKIAETAISLVGSYGIKEAVDPLLRIISGNDVFGTRRTRRIRAIKALGERAEPAALSRMERFFRDSRLPWPSRDERHAAYESLAGYPSDARATFVQKGLQSRDPAVREICRRLAEAES